MGNSFKLITAFFVLSLLANTSNAQEVNNAHKDSLNIAIEKYYELNLKIFQVNSTVEDIDNVFDLFTDDFTYVHPKYGGTYTREDLYNGYTRNQKNGGYDGKVRDIKIINKIIGLNAAVVQRIYVTEKDGEPEMTLFEFKNGKISLIFEYW